MSTIQIPPGKPAPPSSGPRLDGDDLYDVHRWESTYRELHDVPALLIQLQDDLSRSRRRESFWISLVVHLVLVILIVNAPKLERYLPKRAAMVVSPHDWMRQKELTYLEMPPDAQKVKKRPDSDRISDKDRIAMSRKPQVDPKELQKILDSARPGAPKPPGPAVKQPAQQPSPPAAATAQTPSAPQETAPPERNNDQTQIAKLPNPTPPAGKPTFNTGSISPGSAIEQAARAAITNRGGYGGDNGDYGLGQGRQPAKALGELDVLSDTMGVDFSPYLSRVLHDVRQNWYNLIPEAARPPLMKRGKVSIEFAILKDGKIAGMQLTGGSGDISLDRAAWGGITASNPFPPLPGEFAGQYLALRFHFYYNPEGSDLR